MRNHHKHHSTCAISTLRQQKREKPEIQLRELDQQILGETIIQHTEALHNLYLVEDIYLSRETSTHLRSQTDTQYARQKNRKKPEFHHEKRILCRSKLEPSKSTRSDARGVSPSQNQALTGRHRAKPTQKYSTPLNCPLCFNLLFLNSLPPCPPLFSVLLSLAVSLT
uniref:Uncharacterized protein n=1 Tax=Physcomitrium patens TaxID=3218 RepID=A0A2K1K828_PHYPA|nr:hypothetical protein PHYPA_011828 [Physcomitrium patens]